MSSETKKTKESKGKVAKEKKPTEDFDEAISVKKKAVDLTKKKVPVKETKSDSDSEPESPKKKSKKQLIEKPNWNNTLDAYKLKHPKANHKEAMIKCKEPYQKLKKKYLDSLQ